MSRSVQAVPAVIRVLLLPPERCTVVLCVLLLLTSAALRGANCLAANFDGRQARVVSLSQPDWDGFSSEEGASVEMWVKFTDSNQRWARVFQYITLSVTAGTGRIEELAFDVGGYFQQSALGWSRGLAQAYCFRCGPLWHQGYWNHIVATISYSSGDVAYYANGTLLSAMPGSEMQPTYREVPPSGGELLVGVCLDDAGRPGVAPPVTDLSSMLLDDLRVHNRVLAPEEVAAGAWKSPQAAGTLSSLVLHWAFDDPAGMVETDLSGRGGNALRGALDRVVSPMVKYRTYPDLLQVVPPTFSVDSGQSNDELSTYFIPDQSVVLPLISGPHSSSRNNASSAATSVMEVRSLPDVGTLSLNVSGAEVPATIGSVVQLGGGATVNYRYPSSALPWPQPDETPVQFQYTQISDSGISDDVVMKTASLYRAPECSPQSRVITAVIGQPIALKLGGVCPDGRKVEVELLEPPSSGKLYEFLPGRQLWPFFYPIEQQSIGAELQSFPMKVPNPDGALIFLLTSLPASLGRSPAALQGYQAGTFNATLRYRWWSSWATEASAEVTVMATLVNQPPKLASADLEQNPDGNVLIQLTATDDLLPPSSIRYRVARNPRYGRLYQDAGGGKLGSPVTALGTAKAVLRQFADRIPEYSETTGPAFSSQIINCPACCTIQATCNARDCEAVGYADVDECWDNSPLSAKRILGSPPLGWPDDIENVDRGYWTPSLGSFGEEFIVVGFPRAVYVTDISIYEIQGVGAVERISVAGHYDGNRTAWSTVWSGVPQQPTTDDDVNKPRTFRPSICPATEVRAKWVRMDLLTSATATSTIGLASVALFGNQEDSNDWVSNTSGRLIYVPTRGVSSSSTADDASSVADSFEVTASDCSSEETAPLQVILPMKQQQAPAAGGDPDVLDYFGDVHVEEAYVGSEAVWLDVPLTDVTTHLSTALKENVDSSDFDLQVVQPFACFDIYLPSSRHQALPNQPAQSGETLLLTSDDDGGGGEVRCAMRNDAPRLNMPAPLLALRPVHPGLREGALNVVATAHGVSYTLRLVVTLICSPGQSVFECASSAEQCAITVTNTTSASSARPPPIFDSLTGRCVEGIAASQDIIGDGKKTQLVVITVTTACGCALLLLAAIGLLLFYGKGAMKFRLTRRGPPQQGESLTLVITDIQGSTTLWDSFPDQVAADIAIHHQCMRAYLGECHGYEVATEGDSFKCAFNTPEDAILWCTRVQLDLNCAPWSPELEDGGACALADSTSSWANCSSPTVSSSSMSILDSIVAAGISHVSGKSGSPTSMSEALFDPISAAGTEYSLRWMSQQNAENKLLHRPSGAHVPLFRGLRVRMGIHTGIADEVTIHENTRRVTYGGQVSEIAKSVSDMPCGGQIIISGDTMAAIQSMTDLMAKVSNACYGWQRAPTSKSDYAEEEAALSILHLGAHVLKPCVAMNPRECPASGNYGGGTSISVITEPKNTSHRKMGAVNFRTMVRRSLDGRQSGEEDGRIEGGVVLGEESMQRHASLSSDITHNIGLLEKSQELLMVVPWPLRARAMYYPSPSSHEEVTPAWHNAPEGDITILFTFISEWNKLKKYMQVNHEDYNDLLAAAVQQHNYVVRSLLIKYGGYEMEGEAGNFVCAFQQSMDGLRFSIELQRALMLVDWSDAILSAPMTCPQYSLYGGGEPTFRGLRVKIGMCSGKPARRQISARTGRVEYFGPFLNHAARVANVAHGGQVLLHESAWVHLSNCFSKELENEAEDILFSSEGKHGLKGISRKILIIQAIPRQLATRQFPEIKSSSNSASGGMTSTFGRDITRTSGHGYSSKDLLYGFADEAIEAEGVPAGRNSGSVKTETLSTIEVDKPENSNASGFWGRSRVTNFPRLESMPLVPQGCPEGSVPTPTTAGWSS